MSLSPEQTAEMHELVFLSDRRGNLVYKEGLSPNPDDPRSIPINWVLMEGTFVLPEKSSFDTSHLKQTGRFSYTSEVPENSQYTGLLRMIDSMNLSLDEPEEILIVGSMDYKV